MTNEKDILKDILVSEEDAIQNLSEIVNRAKKIFVLEAKSGKIIFKNYSKLTNPQRISAVLIGKYFAKRLNIVNNNSMENSELSEVLNIPQTTLSAPLKALKTKGLILYDKGKFRINPHRIEETISSFEKK